MKALLRLLRIVGQPGIVAVAPGDIVVAEVHAYMVTSAGHPSVCVTGRRKGIEVTGWYLARDVRLSP